MRAILERTLLLAAAGAVASGVVLVISAYRAVDLRTPEPEPLPRMTSEEVTEPGGFRALSAEAVALIADNEPFRQDRERAPLPYLLPGDRLPRVEAPEAPPPPEPPAFTVLGTVVTADGGMAVIETDDGFPPQFVSVNESIGGYRLVSVGSTGATLSQGNAVFNLAVADPALLRDQPTQSRGRNDRRNAEQERAEQARRALEQQTERLRQLMEQTRQNGGASGISFGPANQIQAAPGTRFFVTPDGQGGVIVEEQLNLEQGNGQVRQRIIAIPRGQRQDR